MYLTSMSNVYLNSIGSIEPVGPRLKGLTATLVISRSDSGLELDVGVSDESAPKGETLAFRPATALASDEGNAESLETALVGLALLGLPLVGLPLGLSLAGLPLVGLPLVGLSLVGLSLVGLPLVGLPLVGLPLVGLPLVGLPLVGLPLVGLALVGLPLGLAEGDATLEVALSLDVGLSVGEVGLPTGEPLAAGSGCALACASGDDVGDVPSGAPEPALVGDCPSVAPGLSGPGDPARGDVIPSPGFAFGSY
jgi:hypothetical protein